MGTESSNLARVCTVLYTIGRKPTQAHAVSARVAGCPERVSGRPQVENLQSLSRAVPDDTERRDIESYLAGKHPKYKGMSDPTKLGTVEQYFLEIMDIPRLQQRIEAYVFSKSFGTTKEKVVHHLDVLQAACGELSECDDFIKVLEATLAVGNHLNQQGRNGGAAGFKLDTLLRLVDVKVGRHPTVGGPYPVSYSACGSWSAKPLGPAALTPLSPAPVIPSGQGPQHQPAALCDPRAHQDQQHHRHADAADGAHQARLGPAGAPLCPLVHAFCPLTDDRAAGHGALFKLGLALLPIDEKNVNEASPS